MYHLYHVKVTTCTRTRAHVTRKKVVHVVQIAKTPDQRRYSVFYRWYRRWYSFPVCYPYISALIWDFSYR